MHESEVKSSNEASHVTGRSFCSRWKDAFPQAGSIAVLELFSVRRRLGELFEGTNPCPISHAGRIEKTKSLLKAHLPLAVRYFSSLDTINPRGGDEANRWASHHGLTVEPT